MEVEVEEVASVKGPEATSLAGHFLAVSPDKCVCYCVLIQIETHDAGPEIPDICRCPSFNKKHSVLHHVNIAHAHFVIPTLKLN